MRKTILGVLALATSAATAFACNDTYDDTALLYEDAGAFDVATDDVTVNDAAAETSADARSDAPSDAGAEADADAAPVPARLLLSYNGMSSSELVALNVGTGAVDGRLTYPSFIGTTTAQGPDPYLMEQATDVVARLDRVEPWIVRSAWSTRLDDATDGGAAYSDPTAVVVAGAKAYVLRYTRNEIAIIDPSQSFDAGAPTGKIDLSSFVQPSDSDRTVEQTAAVYVPQSGLVYVLLGNIDRNNVSSNGFTLLCAQTKPVIIAIDVTTDKVVPLANGDATGALPLRGYNPIFGGTLAYDAPNDRLVMMHAGCNVNSGDGGAGAMQSRIIEAVSLFTGGSQTLLDMNAMGFPSALVFIDAHRAIVQLDFSGAETFVWDPATTALGPAIPNAPDSFVYDGADHLFGMSAIYGDGGAVVGIDVDKVRIADGVKTRLASNPFTLTGGFIGGADLWPHP
jgi:hypothetical protein